ncbi:MAG: hypothetical protein BWY75_02302 [bacterium ADurb.Bin425]|nr:MAG: hypothetical protein BWY75_02302 [bacterium ADurb.Bin425]
MTFSASIKILPEDLLTSRVRSSREVRPSGSAAGSPRKRGISCCNKSDIPGGLGPSGLDITGSPAQAGGASPTKDI